MTAPIFWFIKLLILIVAVGAATAFTLAEDVGVRGVLAAGIYIVFSMGLFFKDGFSRRQWARKDYHGFNQMLRWFGLALAWLAVAATGVWLVIWLFK